MDLTNLMNASTANMSTIAKKYKKELNTFNVNMSAKLSTIESDLNSIKANWNDENFNNFNRIAKEKISKLKSQLERSNKLEALIDDSIKGYDASLGEFK